MEGLSESDVVLKGGLSLHVLSNKIRQTSISVVFVHGWPSLAYSWRAQLITCPFHALAFDLPGFGGSSPSKDMSMRFLVACFFDLLDALSLSRVIVVGHDWGGNCAWSIALTKSPKVVGVASFCTPLYPFVPGDAVERMLKNPGQFDYQLYFMQERGAVAARELEQDIVFTLSAIFRASDESTLGLADSSNVRKRGGLLAGLPNDIKPGKLLPPKDLEYYRNAFSKSGFANSLLLYNAYKENTAYRRETQNVIIEIPALMVTATHDPILKPQYSQGMEKFCKRLFRVQIDGSHWLPEEFPDQCNAALSKLYAEFQQNKL